MSKIPTDTPEQIAHRADLKQRERTASERRVSAAYRLKRAEKDAEARELAELRNEQARLKTEATARREARA